MGRSGPLPRRRRVRQYAVIPEEAAYAIAVKFGPQIRALAQRVRPFEEPLAVALLEGLEQIEGVGGAWFDDRRAEQQAVVEAPVGRELRSGEVAALLGIGSRQVTKLADAGVLSGRKPHGRWLIEEASVLAYRQRGRVSSGSNDRNRAL